MSHDSQLDRELKNVPVPDGLLDRLRGVAAWDDAEIDASLVDIAIPSGMMDRLHAAVDDEMLDEAIRDVSVPTGLLTRLRVVPASRRRRRWPRVAVAASLFLLIGSAYLASLLTISSFVRPLEVVEMVDVTLPYDGPLEVESQFVDELADFDFVVRHEPNVAKDEQLDLLPSLAEYLAPSSGPVSELFADMKEGTRFEDDFLLIKFRLLGAPLVIDEEIPYLDRTPQLPARGIKPPRIRQFNDLFLLRHDVHPPVIPAEHELLQSVEVPLSTETTSFDLTLREIDKGRLPNARDICVEDFLAAVGDYLSPAPANRVALQVSGGPSKFGRQLSAPLASELGWPRALARQPAGLIHVGVTAGAKTRPRAKPVHLTIALDISASMRWDDRLTMARRAIKQLIPHLGTDDRISLIAFNEQIVHHVEAVRRDQSLELTRALDKLKAHGGTNLSTGLPAAITVALGQPWDDKPRAQKLVLITDGHSELRNESALLAEELVEQAAGYGLKFSVIELDDELGNDQVLTNLADAADGRFHSIKDPERLRWTLVETLTGTAALAATDVRLKVTLRPQVVTAYRLFGHEAKTLAGLAPVAIESELHQRESAGALFEVWLRPGSADLVGWAEVEWREPETGEARRIRRRISRSEFATSFYDFPVPLQAAAVAAEAAEVLRQSPFAASARTRSLQPVLDVTETVNSTLAAQPSFRNFVLKLKNIERVRLQGGGD